jgi:hypothetical protein
VGKKKFTIEVGFQIVMLFLVGFWLDFLKKKMIDQGYIKQSLIESRSAGEKIGKLYKHNDLFFLTVCDGTSPDYFEEVIERHLGIPKGEQKGVQVTEEVLFQLTIEFCEFVSERFSVTMKDPLRFAITWLIEMKKHPEDHETEWGIWRSTIIDVIEKGARSAGDF